MYFSLIAAFFILLPSASHACAVCFGGGDDNLVRGFTWGVAVLGILPFALMAGLITLIVRAARKHKPHEQ